MAKQFIYLTDRTGALREFEVGDLNEQLLLAGMAQSFEVGKGPLKAAFANFVKKTYMMRDFQKAFFAAQYGTPARDTAYANARIWEKEVDKMRPAVTPGGIEQLANASL